MQRFVSAVNGFLCSPSNCTTMMKPT